MDTHPDRALVYSIIQGGVQAFQHAKGLGVTAEFLVSAEDRKIFEACEEVFLPKGKMPSISNIRQHYKIDIEEPTAEFDIDLCSQEIMQRTLMTRLNIGLEPIVDMIPVDPSAARDALGELVKATNWSLGAVVRTNSSMAIRGVKERYLAAKAREGGLLGYSSPWPSRDKASLGLQPGEVTVMLAKRKSGKSAPGSVLLHDPVTGREQTLLELFQRGHGRVLTWEKNAPIRAATPSDYLDSGVKSCRRITWRSGRVLEAAATHPILTASGWVKAGDLAVGQHTAAVTMLPEPLAPVSLDKTEIKLLAFMIAEGGCTRTSTPTFSSKVEAIISDASNALEGIGCVLRPVPSNPGNFNVVMGQRGGCSAIVELLKRHKLIEKKSIEKTIPGAIFSLPNKQLALFLGRLWSCDGSVETKGVVSYSTGSRRLADQVKHLLLRFGVTSRVRTLSRKIKGGAEDRDYFEVVIRKERVENFKRAIGMEMIGPKAKKIQEVKFQGRSRVGWIRNEELWDQIKAEMEEWPELVKEVGEELGYDFRFQKSHVLDYKSGRIRKKVFEAFCNVYGSDLRWVLDDNIEWDEIAVVEDIGEIQCYDLAVPPTECFIANDVIVHNTWILLKWAEHIWNAKNEKGEPELKPGECILIVSMEMPVWQVLRRLFAIHQKLDYEKFRAGQLDEVEEKRFLEWCDEMERPDPTRPEIIVVASDRCRTVDDIVGLTAQYRPKAVFIDSFYILDAPGRLQMWERMVYNIKAIKLDIAVGFGVPVVTNTQLSGQVKKGDMNAEADAVAYAKAIGDYADAIDGIFGNTEFKSNKRRIIRGMEAREFETVDLEINFDPGSHNYDEIRILPSGGDGGGGGGDGGSGEPNSRPDEDDSFDYDEETILID